MNSQENPTKTVLSINDICTVGRCSLGVIIPIISAMGVCVQPLPTAVLSSHTGGFGTPSKADLTENLSNSLQHFSEIRLNPSAIYTGYLTSITQINLCAELLQVSSNSLKLVDPVMADNGKLYSGFDRTHIEGMRHLTSFADIITPNLTEAEFLLNCEISATPTCAEIKKYLYLLTLGGTKTAIIKGIPLSKEEFCNACYCSKNNEYFLHKYSHIPANYPGTGDIFAAVLCAAILNGNSISKALCMATDFAKLCVQTTYNASTPQREGVLLENLLNKLQNLKTTDAEIF